MRALSSADFFLKLTFSKKKEYHQSIKQFGSTCNPDVLSGLMWVQTVSKSYSRQRARGGGGTLILPYIRRLGPFFGFKILNSDIFLGFQKNKYFFGYDNFVDIFLGSSQNWTIFRGHFYAF